jgi:hypothetical protein
MPASAGPPKYEKKLTENISSNDTTWEYELPDVPTVNDKVPTESENFVILKFITLSPDGITLSFNKQKLNRILTLDRPSKFCSVSFAQFNLKEEGSNKTADYIEKFLIAGIKLNNNLYKCFGWSNSQLKSRCCLLYSFPPGKEPMEMLNALGEFNDINTVAKKSKRIGLLFSEAELGLRLRQDQFKDIPDVELNGHIFTDGCGLMSLEFARSIARLKKIVFHGNRYTPSVIQIRYRGYKGVLMVNPSHEKDNREVRKTNAPRRKNKKETPETNTSQGKDKETDKANPPREKEKAVQFRKSMCKFKGSKDDTLSVLEYSKPYSFGKLNAELVTLLSALEIPDDVFLRKQREYFDLITQASEDPIKAFIFMSYMGEGDSAESIILNGLESIGPKLKKAQHEAWGKMFDKKDSEKVHFLVPNSRLLFGVCDPTGKLRPDECHVRVMVEGEGVRSLHGSMVIVARNPCLHPGDIRKLHVTCLPELNQLVDCIVFPITGKVPPPSMMSGGDLDGDKFFVCWDSDLIPTSIHEPHFYPAAKEKPKHTISHDDLVRYFARYNNASLGRVKNLYLDWVRASENGAASRQCLELNHLFSCCVDGERIKIPDHLLKPPDRQQSGPFILNKLMQQVSDVHKTLQFGLQTGIENLNVDIIEFLAAADDICLTEFELFQLVNKWALANKANMAKFVNHFDFGAFTAEQRAWIRTSSSLSLDPSIDALLQNGLLQSKILTARDLRQYKLGSSNLHWRRLYSSQIDGEPLFPYMLTVALEDFTRKLLVVDVHDRLKIAVLISKRLKPESGETVVDDSITAFSFRPGISSNGRRMQTRTGYRLSWDGTVFQLFNTTREATFIFFKKPETASQGPLGRISIALERFSANLAKNVGRVYRDPMQSVELFVISNRDRIGQQILDLSDWNVPTENIMARVLNVPREYDLDVMANVDWSLFSPVVRGIVQDEKWDELGQASGSELEQVGKLCCQLEKFDHLLKLVQWYFSHHNDYDLNAQFTTLLTSAPSVCVLITDLTKDDSYCNVWKDLLQSSAFFKVYLTAAIHSANTAPGMVASLLKTLLHNTIALTLDDILDLISIVPTTVRSSLLAVELITLLQNYAVEDHRHKNSFQSLAEVEHLVSLASNVSIDRCAEAEECCKCDDWGVTIAEKGECMVDGLDIVKDTTTLVKAIHRIDLKISFRVGDHIRLRSASPPTNMPLRRPRVLDGQVERSEQGALFIRLTQPPPPERCSWYVLPAGNTTTTRAMIHAIRTMAKQKSECCAIYSKLIPGIASKLTGPLEPPDALDHSDLNESQLRAVTEAARCDLTLCHGPPGTGKTTTIVRIIDQWRKSAEENETILVSASTNNAVDNVLEKYLSEQRGAETSDIIRVCPDSASLSKTAKRFWVGAFVEGDFNKPSAAMKEAQKKVQEAQIIFTTCTGAALGLLRKLQFAYVIVDEASQLTEPNCLIALVKGCRKAVLVGDHVQLRPTVTPLGAVYQYDISLFERLYGQPEVAGVAKIMLDTQYRMHPEIAKFPSTRFYGGKLLSGVSTVDRQITETKFDWGGWPVKFINCPAVPDGLESSYFGSKSNQGQAQICRDIVSRLQQPSSQSVKDVSEQIDSPKFSIAVVTPYTAQVKLLQTLGKPVDSKTVSSITVSTIDSFQGREADVIVFCTVRCNSYCSIGFLADERRMNVALTRAKRGLIVVGHKETLIGSPEGGALWKAWFRSLEGKN